MKRLNQHILENLIYFIIWLMAFVAPILGIKDDGAVNWTEVRYFWISLSPFFILFLINNYLLLPRFLLRKRSWSYLVIACLTILVLFVALPALTQPRKEQPPHMHHFRKAPPAGKRPLRIPIKPMPIVNDCIIAVFIIGLNIAIRLLFKSIRDERQIKELENHTLQAELNYLKAQINPHFFMNTLNNIHALVDIDTEKAKETVIELSKIMRYVLYDADQPRVPLAKEAIFLDNYINLMRIRFTGQVEVRVSVPETIPDVKIAPLMLVTLVENAFKHGISYTKNSYVHTTLSIEEDKLHFLVANSVTANGNESPGVGMENLRKRLSLLYGDNYTLRVSSDAKEYNVLLIIPVER